MTGRHVQRLLVEVLSLADRFGHRVPTPELNRFLGDVVATRPPPQKQGHRLKLLYIAQIGERAAALLDPGQQPRQGHPRLRVLPREPAARALRARGHPGDHRLRRAQAAPPRGVSIAGRGCPCCARAAARRSPRSRSSPRWPWRAGSSARAAAATARRPTAPRGSSPRARSPTSTSPPTPIARPTRASRRLAAALPPAGRLRDALVGAVAPQALDVARDVRPWLGDELAYAAVSPADSVVLAAVADRPRAEALVARVGNLSPPSSTAACACCSRARPRSPSSATSSPSGPRRRCARPSTASRGRATGSPTSPRSARALAGAPAGRTLTAYASADGVRQVLVPRARAARHARHSPF